MQRVLIIGATSAIAEAVARRFATQGAALFLVARDSARLEACAADLRLRGATRVAWETLDVNATDRHATLLTTVERELGGLDIALIAHGTLPDQSACQQSYAATLDALQTNALSVIALLTLLANRLEQQEHGTLAVISSVAGDRGRQSNYVYGAAKGAVDLFLSGLRNRLYPKGVHVLTIKPGFVKTPMTAHLNRNGPLWAEPATVANDIYRAIQRRRDVLYTPWFWYGIMLIIRLLPETVFKRLKL